MDMPSHESLIQTLIDQGYLKTPHIIEAFRAIDRKDFVPLEFKNEAYENHPLSIGQGQTISQPLTVAFMLELLQPQPGERILDIGAGSGWQTALLAHIVGAEGKVVAIERIQELYHRAKKNIEQYGFITNGRVEFILGDATGDLPEGEYHKIIAAAAATGDIPKFWRTRVASGGRIVAPVGNTIRCYTKQSEKNWETQEFSGFSFVPLVPGSDGLPTPVPRQNTRRTSLINTDASCSFFSFGAIRDFFVSIVSYVSWVQKKIMARCWRNMCMIFSCLFIFGTIIFINEIYVPHTGFSDKKTIVIPSGFGVRRIAELLKHESIIRARWAFVWYVTLSGSTSSLKHGVYTFQSDATLARIVSELSATEEERFITIPEGWSRKTIAEYLKKEDIAEDAAFFDITDSPIAKEFRDRFSFFEGVPEGATLEGYLFPDTYRIFMHAPPEEIVQKMLENFDAKLSEELRREITRQKKTIFEIVTMASLIEKEVSSDEDRVRVSGILWRRIQEGIPLQVDATIIFITGKKSTKISREETKIESPYNTYLHRGLPVGPITNPGLSAIRAAIYPKKSSYLYYLSGEDGTTYFARTLEEHNSNKAKYLSR